MITSITEHPVLIISGLSATFFVLVAAAAIKWIVIPLCDAPEGAHHATRPALLAGEAPVMAPALLVHGPLELNHEPGLTREDVSTVAWLRSLREARHPGRAAFALRARIAMLAAITSVRPDGPGPRPEPCGATGPAPATDESPWPHDTGWYTLAAINAAIAAGDEADSFAAIAAGWS